jgi:hypothetical protein
MKLNEERYSLTIEKDTLSFKTPFYKVERGSILVKGVYNLELASMLAALATAGTAFLLIKGKSEGFVLPSLLALVAFILGFILFRAFVFRKRELKLTIHKKSASVFLHFPYKRILVFKFSDIESVRAKAEKLSSENPEGIAMVEKIALHHGQIVPDFAAPAEIYSVQVKFKDGAAFTIYADTEKDAPADIVVKIKEFLGSSNA